MNPSGKTLAERFTQWIGSPSSIALHTFFFISAFAFVFFGVALDTVLLVLTTVVSLEAIYLALFIQMTVNKNTQSLAAVEKDIDEIQEDVDEIQEDVELIEKDIDEMQEDVDEMEKDLDKLEESGTEEEVREEKTELALNKIQTDLAKLVMDIEELRRNRE